MLTGPPSGGCCLLLAAAISLAVVGCGGSEAADDLGTVARSTSAATSSVVVDKGEPCSPLDESEAAKYAASVRAALDAQLASTWTEDAESQWVHEADRTVARVFTGVCEPAVQRYCSANEIQCDVLERDGAVLNEPTDDLFLPRIFLHVDGLVVSSASFDSDFAS